MSAETDWKGVGRKASLMRNHKASRRRRGFALREVLIGSLIVGILVLFVETHLLSIRGTTRGAFCQSNARQVGIALFMYAADYDGKLPSNAGSFTGLVASTRPYLRDDSIYNCPETGTSPEMGPVGFRVPPRYVRLPITAGWPDPYLNGQTADPGRTILLFEAASDRSAQIDPVYRHSGGMVCLMFTGQSAWEPDLRPQK